MKRNGCTAVLLAMAALPLAAMPASGGDRAQVEVPAEDQAALELTEAQLLDAIHASLAEADANDRAASEARLPLDDASAGPETSAAILVPDAKRFSFQAVLTDTNGDPLTGTTVDLAFRIYDGTTNVLLEGPINMNGVALTGGVVDVQIPINGSSFSGRALELGVSVNGQAQLTPRIPLTAVPYALRVNRVASNELDDVIQLGDASSPGNLAIYGNAGATTIELRGGSGTIEVDGQYDVVDSVGGDRYGSLSMSSTGGTLELWDGAGHLGYKITGNPLFGGSLAEYYQADGVVGVTIASEAIYGSVLWMYNNTGGTTITLDSDNNAGYGSIAVGNGGNTFLYLSAADNKISIRGDDGNERAKLSGPNYGLLELFDNTGPTEKTVELSATSGSGGSLKLYDSAGSLLGIELDGDAGSPGGRARFYDASGQSRVFINGQATNGGGYISLADTNGTTTIDLLGSELGADGAEIHLREADGTQTIVLDAEHDLGGAYFSLYNETGDSTIVLDGQDGEEPAGLIRVRESGLTRILLDAKDGTAGGGVIKLYDAAGARTITLDSDYSGEGRIITEVLQITGGADLSERFDVTPHDQTIQPGMVVSIDAVHPGRLVVASKPYDKAVAGVISGAGGVKPGMMMGQSGTAADGAHPVALSGRVYCLADASHGAIKPGDLLTTSSTPGHAMKASNYERSRAAVIGKAMTGLTEGKGLVLVLVQPQ